jgi:Uma2 family endonuclease
MLNETIELKSLALSLTEEEFFNFCHENDTMRIERDESRNIIIMPPSGFDSDSFALELSANLINWNKKARTGVVSGSNAGFILPDSSMRSPDAAWISNEILRRISTEDKKAFLPACPEFVIEVKSPSDRIVDLKKKMVQWQKNGVKLGWLVNKEDETTWVYESGKEPLIVKFEDALDGKDILPGFAINIYQIIHPIPTEVADADNKIEAAPDSFSGDTELFTFYKGEKWGTGYWTKSGFLVKKGSKSSRIDTHKGWNNLKELKEKLVSDWTLIREDENLCIFDEDILFSSPSAAASFIHGNDRNGREDWVDSKGKSINDLIK